MATFTAFDCKTIRPRAPLSLFVEENERPRKSYHRLARNFARAAEAASNAHCTLHDFRDTIAREQRPKA